MESLECHKVYKNGFRFVFGLMYSRFLLSVQNKYFSLGTDCNPSKLYFPLALSALYKVSANAELTQFLHSKTFYFNVCDEISNIYIPDDSRKKKLTGLFIIFQQSIHILMKSFSNGP